jgi:hypothetical protein
VQVLNRNVLKWALLPALAVLLAINSLAEAQTTRPTPETPGQATQGKPTTLAAAGRDPALKARYASADSACTTGRRRLWTESGWVVRRVTSCR